MDYSNSGNNSDAFFTPYYFGTPQPNNSGYGNGYTYGPLSVAVSQPGLVAMAAPAAPQHIPHPVPQGNPPQIQQQGPTQTQQGAHMQPVPVAAANAAAPPPPPNPPPVFTPVTAKTEEDDDDADEVPCATLLRFIEKADREKAEIRAATKQEITNQFMNENYMLKSQIAAKDQQIGTLQEILRNVSYQTRNNPDPPRKRSAGK